ncbi:recombination regulator RecX [Marinomonas algarum]|uniref:Regulatory protein RecX n=1 Tax=Marinomonas algarum TaxID=2883105 RepID=A0A9X1LFK9_9GAMM|nr:recombination regulator RecX [Marinomonas algarum]MCB5163054.1 recombination regulator RecX [Marinomonas algarum]
MHTPQLSTFDHALFFLSHREHSSKELIHKLNAKGHTEDDIASAVERLQAINYLNDERFTEIFIRSRISKPLGENRILQELSQKGIDRELARRVIEEAEIDWFELARQLKERRFGNDVATDYKEKAKQARYLQYRGFNFDQIKYATSPEDAY